SQPRRESEPPSVHPAERDPVRWSADEGTGRFGRLARNPECTRDDVGAAAGQHADRSLLAEPVQHLVQKAVSPVDEQSIDVAQLPRELGRVLRTLGQSDGERVALAQLLFDGAQPLLGDRARERIDDQRRALHRREHATQGPGARPGPCGRTYGVTLVVTLLVLFAVFGSVGEVALMAAVSTNVPFVVGFAT